MRTATLILASLILASTLTQTLEAGEGLFRRRDRDQTRERRVVETVDTRPENRLAPSAMLGQFRSTPYIIVKGNGFQGGGYSPIGFYGANTSMVLYGPFSALRPVTAPVTTVTRGYDGVPVVFEGVSSSTPFQPELSPVQYPTRATNADALRIPGIPPRSGNGTMWVDQN